MPRLPRPAACPVLCLALCLLPAVPARADPCDDLARGVAAAVGGTPGRRSGPSVDIRLSGPVKLDLTCRAEPIVQAISAEPSPSPAFFRILAAASEIVVGVSRASVEPILAGAYRAALSERRKSFVQQDGWSASCYADPGSAAMRTLCSVGRIPPG